MSVLIHESAINPDKNLWALAGASGGAVPQVVAGTSVDVLVPIVSAFTEYTPLTYVGSGVGTYVITAYFQNDTQSLGAGTFYGAIGLTPAGVSAGCQQNETTAGTGSMSCVLTVTGASGINVRAVCQSSLAGSRIKAQWSVLFFPA